MTEKANSSTLPLAVQDCRELLLWMIPVLDKLPRQRRYVLGEKLENRVLAVLEALVSAAWTRDKRLMLTQANRDLEVCRHLWRLCHDLQGISHRQYEHGCQLMFQLGRQIGGCLKSSA